MISSHESFRFADRGTGTEFTAEVNWDGTKTCEKVRFTFPNGDKVVVKRDELFAMLFAIGTEDQQQKSIPQIQRTSRWYETVVSVVAEKKIEKGEKITFPIKLTLPTIDEEIIAEAKKDVLKKGVSNLIT